MQYKNLDYLDYDGSQLHHAFAYKEAGLLGPSLVYFHGGANVKEHLVDLEDSISNDYISADDMVHFIIEIPEASIREMVVWQRYFIRWIATWLMDHGVSAKYRDTYSGLCVNGDDIIIESRKLSVSIATLSQFSGLIHVGINIDPGKNCPVAAIGLDELHQNWEIFAGDIAETFCKEYNDIQRACYKVIGV